MEVELKRQLESYLDMYEEKKAKLEQEEKAYFGLAGEDFKNFAKCDKLENQYKEAKRECEVIKSVLADFVLENREKIKVK